MLRLERVVAGYAGRAVLHDVDVTVDPGQLVALLGANGSGKTTTLRAAVGVLPLMGGRVTIDDAPVARPRPRPMLRGGVSLVPEGRGILVGLSVRENLRLGGYTVRPRRALDGRVDEVLEIFPQLVPRLDMKAGVMSGGEQQMLAIGRALVARPRHLLLDEPSMGLAPNVVHHVMDVVRALADDGVGVLLVEQNANAALRVADAGHVLEDGRIVLSGSAPELRDDPLVREAYLGLSADPGPSQR